MFAEIYNLSTEHTQIPCCSCTGPVLAFKKRPHLRVLCAAPVIKKDAHLPPRKKPSFRILMRPSRQYIQRKASLGDICHRMPNNVYENYMRLLKCLSGHNENALCWPLADQKQLCFPFSPNGPSMDDPKQRKAFFAELARGMKTFAGGPMLKQWCMEFRVILEKYPQACMLETPEGQTFFKKMHRLVL